MKLQLDRFEDLYEWCRTVKPVSSQLQTRLKRTQDLLDNYYLVIEELEQLRVKYDERGAAMRETGDVVRSLYVGSEVSKRMRNLKGALALAKEHLKNCMEKVRAPDPYMLKEVEKAERGE